MPNIESPCDLCMLPKEVGKALVRWLRWLEHGPIHQRTVDLIPVGAPAWVAGSIPSWGTHERQWINVSLSHLCFFLSLSPIFSLKSMSISPGNHQAVDSVHDFVVFCFLLFLWGVFCFFVQLPTPTQVLNAPSLTAVSCSLRLSQTYWYYLFSWQWADLFLILTQNMGEII